MYIAEGTVHLRDAPKNLVGLFTFNQLQPRHEDGTAAREAVFAYGPEERMHALRRAGGTDSEKTTAVEPIASLEQASRYVRGVRAMQLRMESRHPILDHHIMAWVRRMAAPYEELVGGNAKLWQEQRLPLGWLYFRALGALYGELNFNAQIQSWRAEPARDERRCLDGLVLGNFGRNKIG